MHLMAKVALGSCVVAIGVCGAIAYVVADDERRDFVKGSTATTLLPSVMLVVDAEVDDEYEDTDDKSEWMAVLPVRPTVVETTSVAVAQFDKLPKGPETDEVPREDKVHQIDNNNAIEA